MSIPNSMPSNRTFGVEIEFVGIPRHAAVTALQNAGLPASLDARHNDSSSNWRIVSDGSVSHPAGDGECVSPILAGMEGLEQVAKALRALRRAGATVNRTCGLHVHFGARDLTPAECAAVYFAYGANEAHFDAVVPNSRRNSNNNYCNSVRCQDESNSFFTAAANAVRGNRLTNEFWRNGRYCKVNLQALSAHGTIEFRQHSGSIDASKVCNWIVALLGFFEHSVANFRLAARNVTFPSAEVVQPRQFGQNSYVSCGYGQRRVYNYLNSNIGVYFTHEQIAARIGVDSRTVASYMSVVKRYAASQGQRVVRTRNVDGNGNRDGFKYAVLSGATAPAPVPVRVAAPVPICREGGSLADLLRTTATTSMGFERLFSLAGHDVLSYFTERQEDLQR